MRVLISALLILSLPGCIFYSRWQESKYSAELLEQQAAMVKDHRACLEENSRRPEKPRDCSVYHERRLSLDVQSSHSN